jgi:energy-coupling factor transport system permease protein
MNERNAMKDNFSLLHPIICFTYFAAVLFCSMFFLHPIFLAISLIGSFVYSIYLNGAKAAKFNFAFLLPMLLILAIVNPLLNHAGMTVILYINDHAITMEAIFYGIAAAVIFISVIAWFSCCNAVMSSDKYMYLSGRMIPSLSLIFSMVLRFVPKYKAQIKIIAHAQTCIGRGVKSGNLLTRARNGMTILSILTTWALENGIETADSMRARGYGLSGRTTFSTYRFDKRDKTAFAVLLTLIATVFAGSLLGENTIYYFPVLFIKPATGQSILIYSSYALLCLFPLEMNLITGYRINKGWS